MKHNKIAFYCIAWVTGVLTSEVEGNLGARPRTGDWLSRLSRARNCAPPPFQTSATQAIHRLILLGLVETVFFKSYINLILQLLFSHFFKSFDNNQLLIMLERVPYELEILPTEFIRVTRPLYRGCGFIREHARSQ